MNVWNVYNARVGVDGESKRDAVAARERRFLTSKLPNSLSYKTVVINGRSQNVAIINTDSLNEKFILSLPGDDILCGSTVEWKDNFWIVTERDADDELYVRAKMLQCNYLLRWIDKDAVIHEQWCVIEDGTSSLNGQYEDRDFIVTRGDSRLVMTISKNEHTTKFGRGTRLLIDDPDSELMLAYELTKPFKLGGVYNGRGVFHFVLQEVNTTDDDSQDLRIADYYKYFPHEDTGKTAPPLSIDPVNNETTNGKKVWL